MTRRLTRGIQAGMLGIVFALGSVATGCAPEVGSQAWCEKLDETPKGDWSANEALDYTKHCIFQ